MSIQATRDAMTGIVAALSVDTSVPSQLADAHVDPVTIAEVGEAVDLCVQAQQARSQARALAAAAAANPDDHGLQSRAAAADARAQALEGAAGAAARRALDGIDSRHGPIEEAVAGAGGSAEVADTAWYDDY